MNNHKIKDVNLSEDDSMKTSSSIYVWPSTANVFYNQQIFVTVKTEKASVDEVRNIKDFSIIGEAPGTILVIPQDNISFNYINPLNSYAERNFKLIILQKNSGSVKFKVNVVNKDDKPITIPSKEITYALSKYKIKSIINLETEKEFILVPKINNSPSNNNSAYNSYSGKLTAIDGHTPIANALIYIFSQRNGQLSKLINITTDPVKGITGSEIPVNKFEGNDFFAIQTNPEGVFGFRAYPIKDTQVRVDFLTMMPGPTEKYLASSIYVFEEDSISPDISPPTVVGIQEDGIIKKIPGDPTFNVTIDSYDGIKDTDELVFFVKNYKDNSNKQLIPTYGVQDKNYIYGRYFSFTFDQLVPNQDLGLSFIAIPQEGEPKYSSPSSLNYYEDESGPGDNMNRIYDKVMVYSNYNPTPKPGDTNGIVREGVPITFDTISYGIPLGGDINNGKPGLHVMINVSSAALKGVMPKIGDSGFLRVSPTGKPPEIINFELKRELVFTGNNNEKYYIIPIPFCYLTWIGTDEVNSKIYIDYTITAGESTEIKKSKLWETDIDTVMIGDDPSANYGCYNILG